MTYQGIAPQKIPRAFARGMVFILGADAGFEEIFDAVFDDDFQRADVYEVVHVHVDVAFVEGHFARLGGEHFHDGAGGDDDFAAGEATVDVIEDAHSDVLDAGDAIVRQLGNGFARIKALVGGEVVAVMGVAQKLHGFNGFLHVKEIRQLGVGDVFAGEDGVAHVADIIRGDDGDMVRGMARGVDDFKVGPAEVDVVFTWHDELIGFYEHGGDVIIGCRLLRMEHIKIIGLQVERGCGNPGFTGRKGHRNVVFLLEITVVGGVVHVDVGAEDAYWREAVFFQCFFNVVALCAKTGV